MTSRQAVVAKLLAYMEQLDIEGVLSLFNETASYQDIPLEREATVGVDQIRFKLEISFADLSGITMQIVALDETAGKIYVERRQCWQFKRGEEAQLQVLCVLEFDHDDKILHWREYWDSGTLYHQLPQYYLDYLSSLGA